MYKFVLRATLCALAPLLATAQELPQKYALLIGIDDYVHQAKMDGSGTGIPKLNFAARDAQRLKSRLESQGYSATELSNEYATRSSIVRQLLRFSEIVREEDTFLLYYAGHGVRRQKTGVVYWLNYDGDPTYPDVDGLRVKSLIELVNEIPARRKLIFLDHCYAGQLEEAPAGAAGGPTGARAGGASPGKLVLARDAMPTEVEDVITQQARGMVVVAASRGLAFEVTDDQHGVFTASLLSAISTPRADVVNRDGNLSIGEITDYLYDEVQRRSRAKQFEQRPVSQVASSNQSEMRAWQPLMRNLGSDEVRAAAQRYRAQLGRWASQGRIPPQVRADCEAVIGRWEQAPDLLGPNDEKIVFLLRQYIDAPPAAEEALIAGRLAQRVEYLRGAQ